MCETVTLLLSANGQVVAVYADEAAAKAAAAKFNADPFVAPGEPDPDAPYEAVTWTVQG